jgi:hypothetical protein
MLKDELGATAAADVKIMMWLKLDRLGKIVERGIGVGNGNTLANAWIDDVMNDMYELIKKHQERQNG